MDCNERPQTKGKIAVGILNNPEDRIRHYDPAGLNTEDPITWIINDHRRLTIEGKVMREALQLVVDALEYRICIGPQGAQEAAERALGRVSECKRPVGNGQND